MRTKSYILNVFFRVKASLNHNKMVDNVVFHVLFQICNILCELWKIVFLRFQHIKLNFQHASELQVTF